MLSLSFHPALTTSEAESARGKHVEKYVENKLVEKARCFRGYFFRDRIARSRRSYLVFARESRCFTSI